MRYYGVQTEVKSYLNRLQKEDGIDITSSAAKTINDRVESLKRSGVWSQYSLGFNDSDADGYFQRASVRDPLGRSEVAWFVRGMKALGLYSSMVCWPLRSYQNKGTGSVVYSLGGLGAYDGTMVNSPTWGMVGVNNFNNSGIQVGPSLPIYDNHTMLYIDRVTGDYNTLNQRYSDYGESGGRRYLTGPVPTTYQTVAFNNPSSAWVYRDIFATTWNVFEMMGYSVTNGTLLEGSKNASNVVSAQPPIMLTGGTGYMGIGNFNNIASAFGVVGTLSFHCLLSKPTNSSARASIYSLLKQTLGNGLGLP